MAKTIDEPEVKAHTLKDVERICGLGKTSIFKAIKDQQLVARKFGGRTIVLAPDLNAFLDNLPRVAR